MPFARALVSFISKLLVFSILVICVSSVSKGTTNTSSAVRLPYIVVPFKLSARARLSHFLFWCYCSTGFVFKAAHIVSRNLYTVVPRMCTSYPSECNGNTHFRSIKVSSVITDLSSGDPEPCVWRIESLERVDLEGSLPNPSTIATVFKQNIVHFKHKQ